MKCLIGIDIGTTNIKVAAYSICGELIKIVKRRMKVYHSRQEYSEYNPTYIWNKVCSCLQEVLSSKNIKQVEAIGISSMGEAGVPVDNKGNPLADIITWYDKRTTPQVKKLINIFGEKYLYNTSGQFISEKYGLNKVLWFKENRPELFKLIHKWLSMEDYIVYCLTGEFATDYSIASRTMAFDINKLGWADAILEELDIPECIFPEAYSGGKVVGQVNGIAAKETNLDKGIPVVLGGHDHACASIGVNVFDQKVILNSMGTAEVTMFAVKDFNPLIRNQGLSIYPHCGNLLYRVISSIQACGGSIEWFLNNFGTELKETSRDDHKNIYEKMMDEVIKSSSGVSGLLYIPVSYTH